MYMLYPCECAIGLLNLLTVFNPFLATFVIVREASAKAGVHHKPHQPFAVALCPGEV